MAKKKVVKKKAPKKKLVKKKVIKRAKAPVKKSVSRSSSASSNKVRGSKRKINLALRRLIFFVILALASYGISALLSTEMYVNLFGLLTILFSSIAGAFLIVLLVLLLLRLMKK